MASPLTMDKNILMENDSHWDITGYHRTDNRTFRNLICTGCNNVYDKSRQDYKYFYEIGCPTFNCQYNTDYKEYITFSKESAEKGYFVTTTYEEHYQNNLNLDREIFTVIHKGTVENPGCNNIFKSLKGNLKKIIEKGHDCNRCLCKDECGCISRCNDRKTLIENKGGKLLSPHNTPIRKDVTV